MAAKKPPKWALPVGIVILIGGAYYIYKKKHEGTQEKVTEQNPYLAQSFIPVTAENVTGVGAVRSAPSGEEGTALLQAAQENQSKIFEFINNKEDRRTQEKITESERQGEKEGLQFERQLRLAELTQSLTGGGSPSSNPNPGTVTATLAPGSVAPPIASPPAPSSNAPTSSNCPADFPLFNPEPGRGCYRISRTTTQGGCICHGYKNGQLECQKGEVKNGSCHW